MKTFRSEIRYDVCDIGGRHPREAILSPLSLGLFHVLSTGQEESGVQERHVNSSHARIDRIDSSVYSRTRGVEHRDSSTRSGNRLPFSPAEIKRLHHNGS